MATRAPIGPLDLAPDVRVLTFTLLVATTTGLLFGLAPAWRAAGVDLQAATKPAARTIGQSRTRLALGKALVVSQIALSLLMIAAAGLLVGSWRRAAMLDPGFQSDGVLLVAVNTRSAQLPPDQRAATYRRILDRLRALPDTSAASAAWRTPFGANAQIAIHVGAASAAPAAQARVPYNEVSEGYFATLRTPLVAGRDFTSADVPTAPEVAIVNQELARAFFGGAAVGRQFRVVENNGLSAPVEIVGIVANTKENSLQETDKPIVYFPLTHNSRPGAGYNFAVRARGSTATLAPSVKNVFAEIDPRLSLTLTTLQERVDSSVKLRRVLALLSGFFGALALLLASIGLYGIMSYAVARRRGEIGVRIALGAERAHVVRMVLSDVSRMMAAGIAIGLLLSFATTRLMTSFLFGVTPTDPATLAASVLVLTIVGLGAAALPARRAARLDPVAALRED
jgi:predicted permease